MDFALIASAAAIFLAPALPFLLGLGEEAAKAGSKKLGESAWEKAKALWGRLRSPVEAKVAAREAAEDVARAPEDARAQGALSLQLEKVLRGDEGLAAEVARLLAAAGVSYEATVTGSGAIAQGPGAVAAGAGGVAVGGDVKGNASAHGAGSGRPTEEDA